MFTRRQAGALVLAGGAAVGLWQLRPAPWPPVRWPDGPPFAPWATTDVSSLSVSARCDAEIDARLVVSTSEDLSNPVYSAHGSVTGGMLTRTVTGLDANTVYHYGFDRGGLISARGQAKTPASGAHSFKFWCGGDMNGGDHAIFDAIRLWPGLSFGIVLGDFHYADIATDEKALFHAEYDEIFDGTKYGALSAAMPTYYMWDGHDGPGGLDETNNNAAIGAYRERVPYTADLVLSGATDAVYARRVVGRVVFLYSDLRTFAAGGTRLGATQKSWLLAQFSDEANAGKLIVWINTQPWITDNLGWFSVAAERTEIADAIKAAGIAGRFCCLSADAHMLAVDDGTNSDFATGGGAAFKVFHAAPLNQGANVKGGPYSEGTFTASNNQVGVVEITDTGTDEIIVKFIGYEYDDAEVGDLDEVVAYEWTADVAA